MTWGEVKAGDVLWWRAGDDELYLVLRREPAEDTRLARERLWLLCLLDGDTVWWPMVHPGERDVEADGVERLA